MSEPSPAGERLVLRGAGKRHDGSDGTDGLPAPPPGRNLRDSQGGDAYAAAPLPPRRAHGGDVLRDEALRHVEGSAHRAPGGPGHAAVAAVLCARAGAAAGAGDEATALELLARAEESYAAACRVAPDADSLCRLTVERARVLEARWRIDGRPAPLHGGIGMLEALADARVTGGVPSAVALTHARLLRGLAASARDVEEARAHALRAARSLRTALTSRGGGNDRDLVLALADALLDAGPEAAHDLDALLAERLRDARGRHRARLLVRSGRLRLVRHRDTGETEQLVAAEADFTAAAQGLPRHGSERAAALALLAAALLATTGPARLARAVTALRDCLTGTAADDPAVPERRTLLGRALLTRYRLTDDPADLREAEHHLGLAARATADPLTRAARLAELGRAQTLAGTGLARPSRYDEATRTLRAAHRAARHVLDDAAKTRTPRRTAEAVTLAARALHLHAVAEEAARRPLAARASYLECAEEWSRLPVGMQVVGEPTPEDTSRRLEALA